VATTVIDNATGHAWTNSELVGASAHDTASISGQLAGTAASGTVTYSLFHNGSCTAPAATTQAVIVSATGGVPGSNSTGSLVKGSYAFRASYSGDPNYSAATGPCEAFSVGLVAVTVRTVVIDEAIGTAWKNTEQWGASAHDTATVNGQRTGIAATGTVTYSLFRNGACAAPAASTQPVTVTSGGAAPNSNSTHSLAAGTYAFRAAYSGDANYSAVTSPCEPFTVHGWKLQPPRNPSGATVSSLYGVSCPSTSATACTAVGYSVKSGVRVTLGERWNGATWAIQTTLNPAGAKQSTLFGVACPLPTACTAVGNYLNSAGAWLTLAERWNGSTWTIQSTPTPAGARETTLFGVACSTAACTAVGRYANAAGVVVTLAERWNGATWAIQPTASPSGAKLSFLSGVACPSATQCTAVGYYTSSSGPNVALVEIWKGGTWTTQPPATIIGARASTLSGAACASTTVCTAVGTYVNSSGATVSLAERWNGSTWTTQATPMPAGAKATSLSGVSCPTTTACTAVGNYSTSGATLTLAEHWNGSTWAIQPTPNPAGDKATLLFGVSCSSSALCTAVWNHLASNGIEYTMAERYS
jgi:hypothetical protein